MIIREILYTAAPSEKFDYLLGLRGLAALGVVFAHAFAIGPLSVGAYVSSSPSDFFVLITQHLDPWRTFLFLITPILGTNFVILFFVQSGYLMGKVFYDGKYRYSRGGIWRFYKNRYFRLAPLLYFNLLVAICFFGNANLSLGELLGDVAFITNFTDRGINLVTWSLSDEMQYYLLAPFVFRFFNQAGLFALLKLMVVIILVYLVSRRGFLAHFEYLYCFLLGYAVNVVIRIWPISLSERAKIFTILIGIVLVDVCFNWLFLRGFIGLAGIVVAVLSAALIYLVECPFSHAVKRLHPSIAGIVRAMVFTGTLSYGIYLWHYMVIVTRYPFFTAVVDELSVDLRLAVWQKIVLYHFVELGFTLFVTYLLATITFYLVEIRFRPGLYSRLEKSQAHAVPIQEPVS